MAHPADGADRRRCARPAVVSDLSKAARPEAQKTARGIGGTIAARTRGAVFSRLFDGRGRAASSEGKIPIETGLNTWDFGKSCWQMFWTNGTSMNSTAFGQRTSV